MIRKLSFDGFCRRSSLAVAAFAVALALLAIADKRAENAALRGAIVFAGDLSACAMLTLYFNMIAHAFSELFFNECRTGARTEIARFLQKRSGTYALTGAISAILKIFFVFTPLYSLDGAGIFLRSAALMIDALLAGYFMLKTMQKRDPTLFPEDSAD